MNDNSWHQHSLDERLPRDFIDNRSVRTAREAFGTDVEIDITQPLIKIVSVPTDYTEKLEASRRYMRSRGITEPKPVRNLRKVA